jgi:hypothetical protein
MSENKKLRKITGLKPEDAMNLLRELHNNFVIYTDDLLLIRTVKTRL